MNWLEKELVEKGLLEASEEGSLELSDEGHAVLSKKSLLEVLLEHAPGESANCGASDYEAEEEFFEQVQQQLNGTWKERQNDPDNWLEIPEFGVLPHDVQFEGFARPILGPNDSDATWKRPIRDAVRAVRQEARRRFGSLQELRAAAGHALAKIAGPDRERTWTTNEVFADHYCTFFQYLTWADRDYRRAKARCIQHLAYALEIAVYIRSSDLPRPDFVHRVRSEQAKNAGRAAQAPKQAAKKDVKDWWRRWQANPKLYETDKKFQEAMLDKHHPVLKSARVIRRWCLEWERQAQSES